MKFTATKLLGPAILMAVLTACGGSDSNDNNQMSATSPEAGTSESGNPGTGATNTGSSGPTTPGTGTHGPANPTPPPVNPPPAPPNPGEPETPAGIALMGVTGTLGDTTYQYVGDLRYTVHGDMQSIKVASLTDDADTWSIALLTPEEGTYTCSDGSTLITLTRGITVLDTQGDDGGCSITVSSSDSMGIEGYFTATLVDDTGSTQYNITNGAFKVIFEDAILDLDSDGISDADDNCPFDANPDQLDDDQDRVGNICEV